MAKKSKKAARSIKPIGRSPVIAVRVPEPLYDRVVKSANDNKRSMSEEMAVLITRGFEWTLAFEAGLLAKGFQRLHGTPHWVKLPEGTPRVFLTEEQAATFLDRAAPTPTTDEATGAGLDQVDAALDDIEDRIRALRTSRRQKQKGA